MLHFKFEHFLNILKNKSILIIPFEKYFKICFSHQIKIFKDYIVRNILLHIF